MQLNSMNLFWIAIAVMFLGMFIQGLLRSQFQKYSKVPSKNGRPADLVARELLDENGCKGMPVQAVRGELTDHFDPRTQTLSLSQPVYGSSSVAAIAVAAHESGHAMQYASNYIPMKIRGNLVPIVNLGSQGAFPIFLIGLLFSFGPLVYLGIILFSLTLLFQLVTLPVELDASRRALHALQDGYFLSPEEMVGAKKVLTAAAFTYVVAALASLVQLLRMIAIFNERRR